MSDRTRLGWMVDALCLILWVSTIVCAATAHVAAHQIRVDLATVGPTSPNPQSGEIVPLASPDHPLVYVTHESVDTLAQLDLVVLVSLLLFAIFAALIAWRGIIPRFAATLRQPR